MEVTDMSNDDNVVFLGVVGVFVIIVLIAAVCMLPYEVCRLPDGATVTLHLSSGDETTFPAKNVRNRKGQIQVARPGENRFVIDQSMVRAYEAARAEAQELRAKYEGTEEGED